MFSRPLTPGPHASSVPDASGGTSTPDVIAQLYRHGIAGLPRALPRTWGEQALVDFTALYAEVSSYEGGTVSRGPNRRYFAFHPEHLTGFLDLVAHPAVHAISETVLGPDYEFVEVAFDVPFPGSKNQPWHRDFPMPEETRDGRLSSLAFNVTTVDVTPEMGPFEVAPGTQFDDGDSWPHGMFPEKTERYESLAQQRCPQLGDMSVRTGLTLHRGTANRSDMARPVLILGVVSRGVPSDGLGVINVTRGFYSRLPEPVRSHLRCRVVDRLEPIKQAHTIEGLVMG